MAPGERGDERNPVRESTDGSMKGPAQKRGFPRLSHPGRGLVHGLRARGNNSIGGI